LTTVETCRVRTIGGAPRVAAQAMAASQLSVELCVLSTSIPARLARSQRCITRRSCRLFLSIDSGVTGIPARAAALAIAVPDGATSRTW